VVLEVGSEVKNIKKGDRVAMEPGVPCGECFLCTNGRYNLCEDVQFAGVYPYHGSLQRYKVHPARWVHKWVSQTSDSSAMANVKQTPRKCDIRSRSSS
jgi:L-iditol 2-dehydrogenase